jgi:glycosyltransferase involved in cell wall biosynthesis
LEFQKKYPDYHLVLSGANKSAGGEVADFINKNNLSEKIHILGFLKDEEVKFIYKDASGLIFPSLFEGFGMPILEAMALKCQVACSNLEVLREVGDKFAVYFDPTRISEIANALTSMAAKAPSSEFLEEARQHANAFSFDRTARETLEVYGKVGPQ